MIVKGRTDVLIAGFAALFLAACGAVGSSLTPQPPTVMRMHGSPTAAMPARTAGAGTASPVPTAWPPTPPYRIEILPGYAIEHVLRPTLLMPTDVKVGPDGRIFFFEMEGSEILELGYDGTVSVFAELDGVCNGMAINSAGEIFALQGDEMIKISAKGEKSVLGRYPNIRGWAFDSQNNLFMVMEGELIRQSPDGEKTVVARGVEGGQMAISPQGDIYLASGELGQIIKVTRDGAVGILADGFVHDAFNIAFDPEGHLYQNQLYFTEVSLEDGSLSPPVMRKYNVLILSRPFAFTPAGEAIFIGPTSNNAVLVSIRDETASVLAAGVGNSRALTLDSSGVPFMGASNEFPLWPGRVVKILPDGKTADYASDFFTIRDMFFDGEGNLFVSDIDNEMGGGGRLVKITPDAVRSVLLAGHYDLSSMVQDSATGEITAFEQHSRRLVRFAEGGTPEVLPVDFGGEAETIDLDFDAAGNLIALVVFQENYNIGPVHRGLYRVTPDYQITLMAYLDTPLATSEDDVFVHPSGDIFVVGPEEHPDFRLLRISPAGEVTVVARKLPYDTLSLVISDSGDIYFTCSAGLFKVTQYG